MPVGRKGKSLLKRAVKTKKAAASPRRGGGTGPKPMMKRGRPAKKRAVRRARSRR